GRPVFFCANRRNRSVATRNRGWAPTTGSGLPGTAVRALPTEARASFARNVQRHRRGRCVANKPHKTRGFLATRLSRRDGGELRRNRPRSFVGGAARRSRTLRGGALPEKNFTGVVDS